MNKKAGVGLFISIISVSTAAILIRSVSENVPPLTIAFYRLLFTVLLITPIFLIYKKFRQEILNIDKRTFSLIILIGVILSLHFAFWITSLDFTSVASSVILVTAHPVLVAPIAYYFLKEKLSIVNIIGIVISIIGVVILVFGNYDLGPLSIDSLEGNIFAILGGIFAGLYILGGRKVRKTVSVVPYAFVVYLTSTILLFFMCLFTNSKIIGLETKDLEILLLMAFISGILGHTVYNWSLKYIRASVASVALLGEPVGSTILAVIILSEIPSSFTLIGGIVIITGIYLTSKNSKT